MIKNLNEIGYDLNLIFTKKQHMLVYDTVYERGALNEHSRSENFLARTIV